MGRWQIDYCNIKMNNKIDLSNEDHCGPCGNYALLKIEDSQNQEKKHENQNENKDVSLLRK